MEPEQSMYRSGKLFTGVYSGRTSHAMTDAVKERIAVELPEFCERATDSRLTHAEPNPSLHPTHPKALEDMPRWFTLAEVKRLKDTLSYRVGPKGFAAILARYAV